jgi:DNA-directed RNA polymerase specialized sigma24 family protein
VTDAVLNELRRTNRLLASLVIGARSETEGMFALSRAGFSHAEIAELYSVTSNAVKLRLRRQRRLHTDSSPDLPETSGPQD